MNYRTRGDFVRLIQENGFKVREANEQKRTGGGQCYILLEVYSDESKIEKMLDFLDSNVIEGYIATCSKLNPHSKKDMMFVRFIPMDYASDVLESAGILLDLIVESSFYLQEDELCLRAVDAFQTFETEFKRSYQRTGRCSTKEKTSVFKTISAKAMSVAIDLVTTDWIQVCFAKSERSNQAWSSIADFITTY